MNTKFLVIVTAVLMLAVPAFAHHSFAMFDYNKEVTLVGEVKDFKWANPHIHIIINVPEGGGVAEWDIEGATPNSIRRNQGWGANTLKPGDKISIVVHPMKDGSKGAMMVRATRADGSPIQGNPPAQ
jgi:hypothetical protein